MSYLKMKLKISFLFICYFFLTGPAFSEPISNIDCRYIFGSQVFVEKNAEMTINHPLFGTRPVGYAHGNEGHQIASGSGSAFLYRKYNSRNKAVDSDYFTKISLFVKNPVDLLSIRDKNEISFDYVGWYSSGSPGFVYEYGYDYSHQFYGVASIVRYNGQLILKFNKNILVSNIFIDSTSKISVDFSCPVVELKIEELTPWLGKPGSALNSFYP
jgi:hypothetical protein